MDDLTYTNSMIQEIRELLENARQHVAVQVNTELLSTYWNIGRIIVTHEQDNKDRAAYGKETLKHLSKELTQEFGKGFSRSNLQNMRAFYLAYPICQSVTGKLTWTHYCELLTISDSDKRSFYEKEATNSGWSVREITKNLTPEAVGQLNMYLNYYAAEVNDEHDNAPIGIILCTDKDSIAAEYALGGLSNNIFASRYVSYIPDKEQLIAQVELVLKEWNEKEK